MDTKSLKGGHPLSYDPVPSVDVDEKGALKSPSALENGQHQLSRKQVTIMKCLQRAIMVLGFVLLVMAGVVIASPSQRWQNGPCHKGHMTEQQEASEDSTSFSALLNSASPKSLHDLLHRHFPNQFRDGVWESERQAVEAVHQADAALATSIVQLAKRQTDNSTAQSSSPPPESSSTPAPSSTSASSTPASSTPSPSQSQQSSSSSSRQPTPSTTPPSSSPPVIPSTSKTPSSSPSASSPGTSSSPSGQTRVPNPSSSVQETSSSPGVSSSRSQAVPSSIDGETTLTTSTLPGTRNEEETTSRPTPTRTSRPIVQTFTSTSNGNVVTITSTTYVPGDAEQTAPPTEESPRATPELQNAAPQHSQKGSSIFAGVIGAAMAVMLA